jgi:hypothetical protein
MDWCLWLSIVYPFTLTPRLRPRFFLFFSFSVSFSFFFFFLFSVSASDSGDQPHHTHSIPYLNYSQWNPSILLSFIGRLAHFLHCSLLGQGSGFTLVLFLLFLSSFAFYFFLFLTSLYGFFAFSSDLAVIWLRHPFPFPDFLLSLFFSYLLVNQHDCNDTCAESNVAVAFGYCLFAFLS